jgi:TP901 family phage tail tape measure protein
MADKVGLTFEIGGNSRGAVAAVNEVIAAARSAAAALSGFGQKTGAAVSVMGQGLDKLVGGAAGLKDGLYGVGVALTAATAPMIGAAKVASDFDAALRNVDSLARLTGEGFTKLRGDVLALAGDDRITKAPVDLAEGLYQIYSSGLEGQAALDALRQAAMGASAGMTSTSTAADVLLSVLNSGIGGVNGSREAMDVLFGTVDAGKLSFEQLAGSLGQVLPTAKQAGVSLQEIGAAVSVMTLSGQTASESTSDLLNLLSKIVRPSEESKKLFDQLGISYGVNALQAKGLAGVLAEIFEKTKGNAQALQDLFPDLQASRGLLSLLTDGGGKYEVMLGRMKHATDGAGLTQAALARQLESTSAKWQKARKELELTAIEAGTKLLPELNKLLDAVSKHPEVATFAVSVAAAAVSVTQLAEATAALKASGFLPIMGKLGAIGAAGGVGAWMGTELNRMGQQPDEAQARAIDEAGDLQNKRFPQGTALSAARRRLDSRFAEEGARLDETPLSQRDATWRKRTDELARQREAADKRFDEWRRTGKDPLPAAAPPLGPEKKPPAGSLPGQGKPDEKLADARAVWKQMQAELKILAMPEGSIELRLQQELAQIRQDAQAKSQQAREKANAAKLPVDQRTAELSQAHRLIAADRQEKETQARARAEQERKEAAEKRAQIPIDQSTKLLAGRERQIENAVTTLREDLRERGLDEDTTNLQVAEEKAALFIVALRDLAGKLRADDLTSLRGKAGDAVGGFDAAMLGQSQKQFAREMTAAQADLERASDRGADRGELIGLRESLVKLLQGREAVVGDRSPEEREQLAGQRRQLEREIKQLREEGVAKDRDAERRELALSARRSELQRETGLLSPREREAGGERADFLDPEDVRRLKQLRYDLSQTQAEITPALMLDTLEGDEQAVTLQEKALDLRRQILAVVERTIDAERREGGEQLRERFDTQRDGVRAEVDAWEQANAAEAELAKRRQERQLDGHPEAQRAALVAEIRRQEARISSARLRMGDLQGEPREQLRGQIAEMEMALLDLQDAQAKFKYSWVEFWRDLGDVAAQSIRGAFGNAFEGLFAGLMGEKGRLNNVMAELFSDLRSIVARALSNVAMEGLENGFRGMFRGMFGVSSEAPAGPIGNPAARSAPPAAGATVYDPEMNPVGALPTAATPVSSVAASSEGAGGLQQLEGAVTNVAGALTSLVVVFGQAKPQLASVILGTVGAIAQFTAAVASLFSPQSKLAGIGPIGSALGLLGGLFGMIGGKHAEGGRPSLGKISLVGEKGPELFVPDLAGTIIPNGKFNLGMPENLTLDLPHPGGLMSGPLRMSGGNLTTHQSKKYEDNRNINVEVHNHGNANFGKYPFDVQELKKELDRMDEADTWLTSRTW